jgi:hypothetical protein
VHRCFRTSTTLADIAEEEFRVLELIEAERQERINNRDSGAQAKSS